MGLPPRRASWWNEQSFVYTRCIGTLSGISRAGVVAETDKGIITINLHRYGKEIKIVARMAVVRWFNGRCICLGGLCVSALMERRAELASVFNNRKTVIEGIEARNEVFKSDLPREYQTWTETAKTDFQSEFNGNVAVDVLEQRPEMVVLWAGYAFSKDYSTPRGHMHAIEDITATLRTGAPATATDGPQPSTCWTCKSPDVPRMMEAIGVDAFYNNKWGALGDEIVNPIGCADCHEPENMNLHISRPALIEAFERQGKDITKATPQEMRSLVCAQCHVEYYFKGDGKYLTFPWDKGFTVEDMEAYYDEAGFYDYIHKLSRTPILKAQHPDFEIAQMGIHGQRGVSCADCHMPYKSEGGVKFSDHHIQSPLAMIDRTCQTCHRESEETLRNNVYERQRKANEIRNRLEQELAKAHIEAKFAWDKGATEEQMKDVLALIRQAQWRWDFGVASHGGSFHAPQEIQRVLSHGLDRAMQARLAISKVLAKHGYTDNVPMPDIIHQRTRRRNISGSIWMRRAVKGQFPEDYSTGIGWKKRKLTTGLALNKFVHRSNHKSEDSGRNRGGIRKVLSVGQDCLSRACCYSGALEAFVGACLHGRSISLFWCCSCCCWQGCMGFANGCIVSDGSVIIRLQFLPWSVWRLSLSLWGWYGRFPPPILRQMSSAFRKCFLLGRLCYFMSGWLLS